MAKIDVIKNSFSTGEIGGSLLGRTDIAQYSYACEVVENFFVRPYGPLISAAGTEYIATVSNSALKTRLIPFVFNREQSYAIEMGVGYFRFYTDSAVVVTTGTTPYQITHSFTESELFDVKFAQVKDVIYLTHPNHAVQTLTRYGSTDWRLADLPIINGPFQDDNTSDITITASATSGSVTITLSATNSTIFFTASSGSTKGHVGSFWKIGGTRSASTTAPLLQGYVQIDTCSSSTVATATVKNTLTTSSATTSFAEGAFSVVRGYPSCCVFFENRLWLANTDYQPQTLWSSKTFSYDDFHTGADDDQAIVLNLASSEANEIQWLASGNNLIAGTYGGSFIISATGDGPVTPSDVKAKLVASWGSESIQPKRIGNYFYYVQRLGEKLRELFYFWDLDTYKSMDKTILSPDILSSSVYDMTYQQNPDTILWCVRSDGTIACLTREVDQEVQGWTRLTTDGLYESVTSIPHPSKPYDQVWAVVNRTINGSTARYIELFASNDPDTSRQDLLNYLHSSLKYNAYEANTSTTISLSGTSGSITITSSTAVFTNSSIGLRIRAINSSGSTVGQMKITHFTSSTIVAGTVNYDFDDTSYTDGEWGLSVTSVSGLDHLESKSTISVLADGGLDKPAKTVSNGTITLGYNYFVVIAGLPYTQKISTTPFEAGSQRGTSQGKRQRINQVGFKVKDSFRGFEVGDSETNVDQVTWRDPSTLMGTPEALYTGQLTNINFNGDYAYGAKIWLVNDEPLPIELLAITCSLTTYDK